MAVYMYVSRDDEPLIPGDPLLGDPLLGDPLLSNPLPDDPFRNPQPVRSGFNFGPLPRLVFSLATVMGVTVILNQPNSAAEITSPVVTNPSAQENNNVQSDQEVVPDTANKKTVLVSDPANTALVREIAGTLLNVESFVPPGTNGHTYEPVPSDAVRAAQADLYIENGMELNEAVSKFVRANYPTGTPEVNLSDAIPKNEVISTDSADEIASHGHAHSFNAHFWTDPMYAIAYSERIANALAILDPQNAATYTTRANALVARLRILDEKFRLAIASIPAQNRKLVVYHDSWSYFGRRYGIPVIGAIQPVSFSEPSADEVRRMIDQIRRENVPAFFGSEVFPSDVLRTIANETGSRYYSDLSDEDLPGEPGTPEHSYEGMMIENVRLITSALGGDLSILEGVRPGASA